jgi:hypothetical protein
MGPQVDVNMNVYHLHICLFPITIKKYFRQANFIVLMSIYLIVLEF